MGKALAIHLQEAKQNIITAINKQNINPCIMKYIVKEIYEMTCDAADKELETATMQQSLTPDTESEG